MTYITYKNIKFTPSSQEVIDALETAADELDSMKDSIMDSAG